jgi:hypothetical protein
MMPNRGEQLLLALEDIRPQRRPAQKRPCRSSTLSCNVGLSNTASIMHGTDGGVWSLHLDYALWCSAFTILFPGVAHLAGLSIESFRFGSRAGVESRSTERSLLRSPGIRSVTCYESCVAYARPVLERGSLVRIKRIRFGNRMRCAFLRLPPSGGLLFSAFRPRES